MRRRRSLSRCFVFPRASPSWRLHLARRRSNRARDCVRRLERSRVDEIVRLCVTSVRVSVNRSGLRITKRIFSFVFVINNNIRNRRNKSDEIVLTLKFCVYLVSRHNSGDNSIDKNEIIFSRLFGLIVERNGDGYFTCWLVFFSSSIKNM